jgi:hypothetical protein
MHPFLLLKKEPGHLRNRALRLHSGLADIQHSFYISSAAAWPLVNSLAPGHFAA